MIKKVHSCTFTGLNCKIIEVEADISNGLSTFSIVGLGDTSVQESKDRVRASIKNSGAIFPVTKKIVNLAPAQMKKQGSLFDLPIAVSLLIASNQIKADRIGGAIIIGELSLNGNIKEINGALAITQYAQQKGFNKIFLPSKNAKEASFINSIDVYPLENLSDLISYCNFQKDLEPYQKQKYYIINPSNETKKAPSFSSIIGLQKGKRALVIAASGGHNILLHGSPGCGKTLLARSLQSILPAMNKTEILETTKIFSISGLLDKDKALITERPFREVHHTASAISLIGGGGSHPRPGEISLAHNGVLFFDEISEFPRPVLESLRQPLEDRFININRSNFSIKYPCRFILVGTTNPCPCGYKNDSKGKCICTTSQVRNYIKKLSGPLLDRFDLFLEVEKIDMKHIYKKQEASQDMEVIQKVKIANMSQNERFKDSPHINNNSDMTIKEIRTFCILDDGSQKLLNKATRIMNLSNRGYIKTIKLARTIADLEQSKEIRLIHLAEALQYRYTTSPN